MTNAINLHPDGCIKIGQTLHLIALGKGGTMTETCYQKYTADYDRKTVHALLTEILSRGYTISVNDGEEWTLNQSSKINEIKAHLATSGEDLIRIWDNDNAVGSFYLIYENGSEYMETICDHTSNEICDSIYKAIDK